MKDIANVTGIATDADYPTNKTYEAGVTVVATTLYQDIVIAVQKMVAVSGVTPNGLFDNNVNGFQVLTALQGYLRNDMISDVNLAGVIKAATLAEAQKMALTDLSAITSSTLNRVVAGRIVKDINIGDWNMDTTDGVNIPHGLTATEYLTIKGVYVTIIDDSGVSLRDLQSSDMANFNYDMQGSVEGINATNIFLKRKPAGYFDTSTYDSVGFNRGYITFSYIKD